MAWVTKWDEPLADVAGLGSVGNYVLVHGMVNADYGYLAAHDAKTGQRMAYRELNVAGLSQVVTKVADLACLSGQCVALLSTGGNYLLAWVEVTGGAISFREITLSDDLAYSIDEYGYLEPWSLDGESFDLYVEWRAVLYADIVINGSHGTRITGTGTTATVVPPKTPLAGGLRHVRNDGEVMWSTHEQNVRRISRSGSTDLTLNEVGEQFGTPLTPFTLSPATWGWTTPTQRVLPDGSRTALAMPAGGEGEATPTRDTNTLSSMALLEHAGRLVAVPRSGSAFVLDAVPEGLQSGASTWLGERVLLVHYKGTDGILKRLEPRADFALRSGPKTSTAYFR